ncbi:MAG: hypothetical protein NTZ67_06250 [Gammaproteobacteria bacterium]|nr:hypothetical protein [Gammaproteobacteria bacterium]
MPQNNQFSQSQLTATLQSTSFIRDTLNIFERFARIKIKEEIIPASDNGFDLITEDDFDLCSGTKEQETSSGLFQKPTRHSLEIFALIEEFKTISDDEIASLLNNLTLSVVAGHPDFKSTFNLITINEGEKQTDFLKRKLFSLPYPLFQNDFSPLTADEKKIVDALTQWHEIHSTESSPLDQLLAKTSYFYDEKSLRLIISHAAVDTSTLTMKQIDALNGIMGDLSKKIITHLKLEQTRLAVEHIVPTIEPGRTSRISSKLMGAKSVLDLLQVPTDSRHIVLNLRSEIYFAQEKTHAKNKTFDPRTNVYDTENYISLEVQEFANTVDCGRHVAAMNLAVQKLLSENKMQCGALLNKADFEPYRLFLVNAKNYATASELRNYFCSCPGIHSLISSAIDHVFEQTKVLVSPAKSTEEMSPYPNTSSNDENGQDNELATITRDQKPEALRYACSIQAMLRQPSPFSRRSLSVMMSLSTPVDGTKPYSC